MFNRQTALFLLPALILSIIVFPAFASETEYTFQQLLDDASLVLKEPEGFVNKEP